MKSKASVMGHSIHPMIVKFPISFLTGAFFFDLFCLILNYENSWYIAYYLEICGLVAGFLAAIPGTIDYLYTIPPQSSAKKRGSKHALLNVSALVCFIIAFVIRSDSDFPGAILLILEFVGTILLFKAGWHGAALVNKNQIGIQVKYANNGKWKEEYIKLKNGEKIELSKDNLKVNQMKLLNIEGKRIVLARTESEFVAFDDHCPHHGGSLASGSLICGTVQCPWHGSQFNVKTGSATAGPASGAIQTYKVEENLDSNVLILHYQKHA